MKIFSFTKKFYTNYIEYIYIWVFCIIALMLFSALIFLLINIYQDIYSNGWQTFTEKAFFPAKMATLATLAIAILTTILAWETRELRNTHKNQIEQIRKNGIRPNVNIYLKRSPAASFILDIHIINSGPGVAQNIKFTFIDQTKNMQDVYDYLHKEINKISMLKNGISSLAIGEKRHCIFFDFLNMPEKYKGKILKQSIKIDVELKDIEGEKYSSTSYLNLTEYENFQQVEPVHPLYKISKSLEDMQKEIRHFAIGFRRLRTDVYTSEDRDEERKLSEQRRAEQQRQEKKDSKESDTDD